MESGKENERAEGEELKTQRHVHTQRGWGGAGRRAPRTLKKYILAYVYVFEDVDASPELENSKKR